MIQSSPFDDEAGFAMIYALMVMLIVAGVVAVVFASSRGQQVQSTFESEYEDTVHVAEAGAEAYLQLLADDPESNSGIAGPTASGQDPAEWAIAVATATESGGYSIPDSELIDLGEGETLGVRPTGEDANYVYGIGFVPSRDAYVAGRDGAYVRVIRVQVAFSTSTFEGDFALLAGGNLTMSGTYDIGGAAGGVHTNGGLEAQGSGAVADGMSYSGSCSSTSAGGCAPPNATGPVDSVPIPRVDPLEIWKHDEAILIASQGQWYDYCAGVWYRRAASDDAPCQGTVVTGSDPNIQPWGGTNYNNPTADSNAVYYFNGEHDLDIKQPHGRLTFITFGDIAIGPSANGDPPSARYPGLYLLADGDISVGGNAVAGDVFQLEEPALVWANGSLKLGGTLSTDEVAFVARDSTNIGTTYQGGGAGSIRYDGGARAPFGGLGYPIVVQWDEVR